MGPRNCNCKGIYNTLWHCFNLLADFAAVVVLQERGLPEAYIDAVSAGREEWAYGKLPRTHQDWGRARTAGSRFARDDKELEPQLGEATTRRRPLEIAKT